MPAIDKLKITGFKAFPGEFEFAFGGKHLLMYGENGSGKSSVYYALHCLFQSPLKHDIGKKYFNRLDEFGNHNPQHLINLDAATVDPKLEIWFEEPHAFTYGMGKNGYGLTLHGGRHPLPANVNGVFVNHQFLFQFFSFRNSEKINLFPVLEKDVFSFVQDEKTSLHLGEIYDELKRTIPKKGNRVDKNYLSNIEYFNKQIKKAVEEINLRATDNYNDYFKSNEDLTLRILLKYDSNLDKAANDTNEYWLKYDNFIEIISENGVPIEKRSSYKKLNEPFVGLEVTEILSDESERKIDKPQTYFNEAKLTAIALSIRFALLNLEKPADGRFLALDDMLISLDMSNRTMVVNFLLDVVADKYKIYLFTHDLNFYDLVKKKIDREHRSSNSWVIGKLYMNDFEFPPNPEFQIENCKLLLAKDYLLKHDYSACGIHLRKECEGLLDKLLPINMRKSVENPSTDIKKEVDLNLNDKILNFESFCAIEGIDFSPFKSLKIYKDVILNTLAHSDSKSPIFKRELLALIKSLEALQEIKRKNALKTNKDISFKISNPTSGEDMEIRFNNREPLDIISIQGNDKLSFHGKCKVTKIIKKGIDKSIDQGYDSVYDIYEFYCSEIGIPPDKDLLDLIVDHGKTLREKLLAADKLGITPKIGLGN